MSEGAAQSARFREVMSRFPTGVTVVAGVRDGEDPFGLTVNSFASVSLDPPLVLVCINRASSSHDALLEASSFGISILAEDQAFLAARFASDPPETRFDDVGWSRAPLGAPYLLGAVAWLECTRYAAYPGGDHTILVGRVESTGGDDTESLLFHRGGFGSAAP